LPFRLTGKLSPTPKARKTDNIVSGFGRPVLYGTGEAGTRLKREIVGRAAEQSERLYRAMVNRQQSNKNGEPAESNFRREDVIFDPTRPVQTDRETVLAKVAEKLLAAKKAKT